MGTSTTTSWLLLAAAVAAILLPTLLPLEELEATAASKWVLRDLSSSDLLRNLILFAPLGAALSHVGYSATRCVALALLLSAGIETLQLWIPGRFASPLDLLTNALGAALGHGVIRRAPLWLSPNPARSRWLVLAAGALAAGSLFATAPLLAPTPFPAISDVQWVPVDRELYPYEGQLLAAELNSRPLPRGRLPLEGPERKWLSSEFLLALEVRAGPAPQGLAGFLRIQNLGGDEMLLVGPDRRDLIFRYRIPGQRLGLEGGILRWKDGLAGVAPDQRMAVRIERRGEEICLSVDGARRCSMSFSHADGWKLLAPGFNYPRWVESALSALWLAGLFLPLGFWSRRNAATLVAWLLVGGVFLLSPQIGDLRPIPLPPLLAATAAALLGIWLRGFAKARLASNSPGPG